MSLIDSNSNGMVMPVGPMYGNGGNGGFGWGDNSMWMMYQKFIDEAERERYGR